MINYIEIFDAGNAIYSVDVAPHGKTFALIRQDQQGLVMAIHSMNESFKVIYERLFKELFSPKVLIRYLDANGKVICFINQQLFLIDENNYTCIELASGILVFSLDREAQWFEVVLNQKYIQVVRWNVKALESPKIISLESFSKEQLKFAGIILYGNGRYTIIVSDFQLINLDWEENNCSYQPFNYLGVDWMSINGKENVIGLIGRGLKGLILYSWPDLERYLPDYFSEEMRGYTRLLFHSSKELIAISSRIGYIALICSVNGQRIFSQKVHTGRVRDMVFFENSCEDSLFSCGEDGRICNISISEETL